MLSVSRCSPQPTFLPKSQYLRIPIDDSLRDDLLPWIPQALRFIGKHAVQDSLHQLGLAQLLHALRAQYLTLSLCFFPRWGHVSRMLGAGALCSWYFSLSCSCCGLHNVSPRNGPGSCIQVRLHGIDSQAKIYKIILVASEQ